MVTPGRAIARAAVFGWVIVLPWVGVAVSAEPVAPTEYEQHVRPLLETYCTGCHGQEDPEAGLRLEYTADALDLTAQHEAWRHVQHMLRKGEMPPESELQPTENERATLLAWVDYAVAQVDCSQLSQPGRVTIHRLNRTQYNNTIRDLVGVNFTPADEFPADDVGNGFDNIADVLSLPPLLMEKYLDAAEQIVTAAMNSDALRAALFVSTDSGDSVEPGVAARQSIERFASRAFRRPLTDDELSGLVDLEASERAAGVSYPESMALPMTAVLASPQFLFRIELDPAEATADTVRELGQYELATRLSYFLWSSMPDDRLFQLAAEGRLSHTTELRREVERMLADPQADALLDNFVGQWLQLRSLRQIHPDLNRFPQFDDALREAMLQETRQFARAIIQENRSVLEFLDADFTFLNERLARHYGMEGVEGDEFRRVSLTDERRGGILTQASILTLTSNPTRTSPVKRGKWILDNILGTPPPPPPPGVEELPEEGETELLGSLRERMEQHRNDASCAVCHKKMDALGLGFENFDAVGAWRDRDGQFEIDPAGALPGNQQFQGPAQLRQILKQDRRDEFARCLSEKMLTYALGRELQSYDRCAVDAIIEELSANEFRFQALVMAIVQSDPFRKRGFRGETQ